MEWWAWLIVAFVFLTVFEVLLCVGFHHKAIHRMWTDLISGGAGSSGATGSSDELGDMKKRSTPHRQHGAGDFGGPQQNTSTSAGAAMTDVFTQPYSPHAPPPPVPRKEQSSSSSPGSLRQISRPHQQYNDDDDEYGNAAAHDRSAVVTGGGGGGGATSAFFSRGATRTSEEERRDLLGEHVQHTSSQFRRVSDASDASL